MTDLVKYDETWGDWPAQISASWQKSASAIIEAGRLISEAKAALPFGVFTAMISNGLPFGPRTAQMLMAIADDPRLTDPKHVSLLPPSWGSMYELTKLDDAQFKAKIEDGTIRPEMERREIIGEAKQAKRTQREAALGAVQCAMPEQKFGVIYADPEWRFEPYSRESGMDRAPENHYPTSVTDEIAKRPVRDIAADDCVLFLWATVPMLPDALRVMAAWGFTYKSHCVWTKDKIGTGYWFRNAHELLLVGTKGNIPAPAMGTQFPSTIEGRVTKHSAKPECFAELIEQYFPSLPKIELNRRGPAREGWSAWGNEAEPQSPGASLTERESATSEDSPESNLPDHDPETGEIKETTSSNRRPESAEVHDDGNSGGGHEVISDDSQTAIDELSGADADENSATASASLIDDDLSIPPILRRGATT